MKTTDFKTQVTKVDYLPIEKMQLRRYLLSNYLGCHINILTETIIIS